MRAAVAEQLWDVPADEPANAPVRRFAKSRRPSTAEIAPPAKYADMAQKVAAELSTVALDDAKREALASRIHMLEAELRKRAERLANMEDAVLEKRSVESHRARRSSRPTQQLAVIGSSLLAAMFKGVFVISVL